MNKETIISDLKNGKTIANLAREYHVNNEQIAIIKRSLNLPSAKIITKCNNTLGFKEYFINTYNSCKTSKEFEDIISKHSFFKRISKKSLYKRILEIRNLYELKPKMFEHHYISESDRIKGYIIRNSKFMAKRRGIYFNLTYQDFEIPEYCPILGIKLKYMYEGNGNDPAHASLDRIDNSKGYIKGNVIVVSRLANAMKNEATFEQLKLFCKNMIKLVNHYETQGALESITDIFKNYSPKLSLDS